MSSARIQERGELLGVPNGRTFEFFGEHVYFSDQPRYRLWLSPHAREVVFERGYDRPPLVLSQLRPCPPRIALLELDAKFQEEAEGVLPVSSYPRQEGVARVLQ